MRKNAALHKRYDDFANEKGLKQTRQRVLILETFLNNDDSSGHMALDELLERVQERLPTVGYATVYRTMKLLVEAGVALERRFRDGQTRFERADLDDEHHDHIICVTCSHIFEFEDPVIERRQEAAAKALGLEIVSHRLDIYAECSRKDSCPYLVDKGHEE